MIGSTVDVSFDAILTARPKAFYAVMTLSQYGIHVAYIELVWDAKGSELPGGVLGFWECSKYCV